MPITKPNASEYPLYYHTYIGKVMQNNLADALTEGSKNMLDFLHSIPVEKYNYCYAPGKWTIGEVVAHIIDTERIFAYRALTFARNDKNELPGFEENEYVPESNAQNRTFESLMNEYRHLRLSNIQMFEGFTAEASLRMGKANSNAISVRALGFIIPGHELHHMQVIKDRYL